MQKNDTDKVLQGEIVDEAYAGSAPVPKGADDRKPSPQKKNSGSGWLEMIAAIGGGIVKWLASSSRTTLFGRGDKPGQGGGGRMRRRRGGGR